MFGHLPELFIIMVVALIVFGPEKLPEVAAQAGKMMREVRSALDTAMNPHDTEIPDDFSTYYYESMARSGESVPESPEIEEYQHVWPDAHDSEEGVDSSPRLDESAHLDGSAGAHPLSEPPGHGDTTPTA